MINAVLGKLELDHGWTERRYAWFRAVFGAYLAVHFAQLAPFSSEMFSRDGVLPREASPLLTAFPNVLALSDGPGAVIALVLVGLGGALCLTVGRGDRVAAIVVWYVWACLFGRNPLISNPGLPYVGVLLVVHALRPRAIGATPAIPNALFFVVWTLMSVGYSYSGLAKLMCVSWIDGSAIRFVLESPLARPGVARDALLSLPHGVLAVTTWATLAVELLFAPLALLRRARPCIWLVMFAMHLLLIAVVDFADLSMGMVMLHLFTLDPAWILMRSAATRRMTTKLKL